MSKIDEILDRIQRWSIMNIGSREADDLMVLVAEVIAVEREECARIADLERHADKAIAKAIRARSGMRH